VTSGAVYLKSNLVVEPLYQQWFAWPHLISPATAAMNVRNRHLPIMDSYLQAPAIHAQLAKSASMVGAPLMSCPAGRAPEVRALRERTQREYAIVLAFAEAIGELQAMLEREARGFSLEPLYACVPEILRGYVELSYDLRNRPQFRFLESLLYRSRCYDPGAQSVRLYLSRSDSRSFVLSTPRLFEEGALDISVPFSHEGLDVLFRMRTAPAAHERALEALGLGGSAAELSRTFFTNTPPVPQRRLSSGDVQITYFGHACVLLESAGVTILADPAITADTGTTVSRFTHADLPEHIDYVLITHNHQDHVLLDTLLELRPRIREIVVPCGNGGSLQEPSLKLMFQAIGFRNVRQLMEFESISVLGCCMTGIPFLGEHADLDIRAKLGYHVRLANGYTVLLMADARNVEPMLYRYVREVTGDVDMLFLGMECDGAPLSWLYGPLMPEPLARPMDQSRRLAASDCERGLELIKQFRPAEVYVYAMGQEPWLRHIMGLEYHCDSRPIVASNELVATCREQGILARRLFGREVFSRGS
jgi:L-ascorbate metabolism protein UlaG (beta-lactamase superfamily)